MGVWSPFEFNCGREMANRFAIAPLTTDSSHEDGTVTDEINDPTPSAPRKPRR